MSAINCIQRCWRRYKGNTDAWKHLQLQIRACYKIQRSWRASKWVRMINQMAKKRKNLKVLMIQKYMRGYSTRKSTLDLMKQIHLGTNFDYLDRIKTKYYDECQIEIRFAWKIFQRKKARKLAKKRADAEKAKQGKFGSRANRSKTIATGTPKK